MNNSVFSVNEMQAMGFLIRNKNALIMLANILICKSYQRYNSIHNVILDENECFFTVRHMYAKPVMSESQKKTALKNLVQYGFIEIVEFASTIRIAGLKRIRIIVNPFDPIVAQNIMQSQPSCSGYPIFN